MFVFEEIRLKIEERKRTRERQRKQIDT